MLPGLPAACVRPADLLQPRGDLGIIQVGMIAALAADELERAGVAALHPAVRYAVRLAPEVGGLAVAGLAGKRGASCQPRCPGAARVTGRGALRAGQAGHVRTRPARSAPNRAPSRAVSADRAPSTCRGPRPAGRVARPADPLMNVAVAHGPALPPRRDLPLPRLHGPLGGGQCRRSQLRGPWSHGASAAAPWCEPELWLRDSEHKGRVSSRGLESRPGDVVLDVVVDHGQCLA